MNYWHLDKQVSIKGKLFHVCAIFNYAGLLLGVRKITITDGRNYLDFVVWNDGEVGRLRKSNSFGEMK